MFMGKLVWFANEDEQISHCKTIGPVPWANRIRRRHGEAASNSGRETKNVR